MKTTNPYNRQPIMRSAGRGELASFSALCWLLFFISPLISLVVSLTRTKSEAAKNLIWAACGFYGLMFNILPNQGTDCVRYASELKQMHLTQMSLELLSSTFYREGGTRYDIYQPMVTLVISRFTDDYRILFAVFGLFLGFFYSRTIWYFVERLPQNTSYANLIFIISAAALINPGISINGARMYTALYVFTFASLKLFETRQYRFILLAALSIFIHFSFAYAFAILLLVPIAERLPGLTVGTFTLSFLLPSIENTMLTDLLSFMPGFQQRVSSYLSNPEERQQDLGWLLSLSQQGNIAFMLSSGFLLPAILKTSQRPALNRIAVLALLLYTGVNVCWNVASFSRFAGLSMMLICGLWSLTPATRSILRLSFQFFGLALAALIIPSIAIAIRLFLGFVSIGILIGNPLTYTLFRDQTQSAYDFLLSNLRPW
jgi:hypothetical protein